MLRGAVSVLSADDVSAIERGLSTINGEIERSEFAWSRDFEDVLHEHREAWLIALIGDAGKRLHTGTLAKRPGRDRHACSMPARGAIDDIAARIVALRHALLDLAEANASTVMPGFTHMQVAQPVSYAHHLMAYFEMLNRDAQRFADCRKRVNRLPLGSAALAGTSFPIDRLMVAKDLGFDGVCENSLDAVSDRDFAIEFCAAGALVMTHLSRFCEELIIWMNPRFAFVDLADRFCTGSSIMPQKKNPDVPELIRGKTGRVNGNLVALLTLMKGQPLAYNKDNQEDKEPLFDTVDTVAASLRVFGDMLGGIKVNAEAMRNAALEGYATATDLADYLVKKGLAFREAHEAVAQAVRFAEESGRDLAALKLAELQQFSKLIANDVFAALTLDGLVASRDGIGGTAPAQVLSAVRAAREALAQRDDVLK